MRAHEVGLHCLSRTTWKLSRLKLWGDILDADWAQAWLAAAAILFSTGLAIGVPAWQRRVEAEAANRGRLKVWTTFSPPAGLLLQLYYYPEFTHQTHRARVKLSATRDAQLYAGKYTHNAAPTGGGGHLRPIQDGVCIGGIAVLTLVEVRGDESVSGVAYILPEYQVPPKPDRISAAKVQITIETDTGVRLLRVDLSVSALSPPEGYKNF